MKFESYLCVPGTFGRIAPSLLDEISSYGFTGVRVDVSPGDSELDHDTRWQQILSFSAPSVTSKPIFLLGPGHIELTGVQLVAKTRDFCTKLLNAGFHKRQDHIAIEIGNEPDLAIDTWKDDPEGMALCFADCFTEVRNKFEHVAVLSPSVSNLNSRGLNYLEAMAPNLPSGCAIAFHRYPNGRRFGTPHDGFSSRFSEVEVLTGIAGDRELWATEVGWAEQNTDYTLSEPDVATRMEREAEFWKGQGCRVWTAYQLNSAVVSPSDDKDERRLKTYGFRRPDETWKPVAEAMRAFTENV